MPAHFYTVLETPVPGSDADPNSGQFLARVVEAHPILEKLLDFCVVDPLQIAVAVGMVYPYEEDGADDLADIDFGPVEWFEPPVGLSAVQAALTAIRREPLSLAAAIYDPTLRPADVLADLEAIEQVLLTALQQETRFHFVNSGTSRGDKSHSLH